MTRGPQNLQARLRRRRAFAVAMRRMTWRRVLRVAGWNAVLLAGGLALVAAAAETWLRATRPWRDRDWPISYVPGVSRLSAPHSESRWTDHKEFWQVSRANSLGFLDREPPSPELGRAGCHVAFVGDSFVEAMEVALADRLHVRLEELAASRLPHLDVVTTAWGVNSMGQIQQLPMWDKWIRRWSPNMVVLVFVHNDFSDNARGDWTGGGGETELSLDVEGPRIATAHRAAGGRIVLRLPGTALLPRAALVPREPEGGWTLELPAGLRPWLLPWWRHKRALLATKSGVPLPGEAPSSIASRSGVQPGASAILPSPDLDFTAYALDQWRERTQRAGSRLVALSAHVMRLEQPSAPEEKPFERLVPMAEARGIPLVDQYGYIARRGGDPRDASWPQDWHWNPQGHQWAAEAMLEHLEENPGVCGL